MRSAATIWSQSVCARFSLVAGKSETIDVNGLEASVADVSRMAKTRDHPPPEASLLPGKWMARRLPLAAEPGNEQRCLDKSLKSSEVLPEFFVPFVSSCSHLRHKPLGLLFNFHAMKLVDGISRLILPGANVPGT